MFDMWNNISTKLEQQVQEYHNHIQQPHTSSGSIKGSLIFYNKIQFMCN